jgi:hypothetical protein
MLRFAASLLFWKPAGCTPGAASIKIKNVEKPILWKQITAEFRGRAVSGSYAVEDGGVKVGTPDGEKTAPLVGAGGGRLFPQVVNAGRNCPENPKLHLLHCVVRG